MPSAGEQQGKLEAFVYRVLGPDGKEHRWIARSVHGPVAHGKTPARAVENLNAGMEALAEAAGVSLDDWKRRQATDRAHFVRAGELVQA